jgi:hypothetical protein
MERNGSCSERRRRVGEKYIKNRKKRNGKRRGKQKPKKKKITPRKG